MMKKSAPIAFAVKITERSLPSGLEAYEAYGLEAGS